MLSDIRNVNICEPLDYATFAHVMQRASIVLTDSGGVQEEAPGFGRPVLVLRETTERPEAVEAGTVRLVGTDEDRIFDEARRLPATSASAYAEMAQAVNPYGDGHASERCVAALEHFFGLGDRMPDFAPIAGEDCRQRRTSTWSMRSRLRAFPGKCFAVFRLGNATEQTFRAAERSVEPFSRL